MSNRTFKILYLTAIWSYAVAIASSLFPWVEIQHGVSHFTDQLRGLDYFEGVLVLLLGIVAILAVVLFRRSYVDWTIYLAPVAGLAITALVMYLAIDTSLLVDDAPLGVQARVGFGLVLLLFAGPLGFATSFAMVWEVFKSRKTGRDFFTGAEFDTGLPSWRASEAERR